MNKNKIENELIKDVLLIYYSNTKIVFRKIKLILGVKKSLKTENVKFLTSLPQVVLKDMKKSFEGTHLVAKNYRIPESSPH